MNDLLLTMILAPIAVVIWLSILSCIDIEALVATILLMLAVSIIIFISVYVGFEGDFSSFIIKELER